MIRARFFVAGTPAPQGSKRIVQPKGHRWPLMIEASKKLGPWREAVARNAMMARQRHGTLTVPVSVMATFRFARPKKPARAYPTVDLDKLLRGLFDGLVQGMFLADDSWVAEVTATKLWCDEVNRNPGCEVMISDF